MRKSIQVSLNNLKYGTVIKRGKEMWVKCQGADGDIFMAVKDHGHWLFIDKKGFYSCIKHWRKFEILWEPK